MSKRNYSKLFKISKKAQLRKLKQNEHKKGFDSLNLTYIDKRLDEEITEYFDAREKPIMTNMIEYYQAVEDELADIMNFAAMGILYTAEKRKRLKKELKKQKIMMKLWGIK